MDPTPSERKRELRALVVERILAYDPETRSREQEGLARRFPDLPGLAEATWILLYAPAFPEEIDTWPFFRWARRAGKRVAYPRVNWRERRLELAEVEDEGRDFRRAGALKIPEPRKPCPLVEPDRIDWVLVPGLAFDAKCQRVGRGAGHYDRLLPRMRADARRWALVFDRQWVDEVPAEGHDVPLDGVASWSRTATRGDQSALESSTVGGTE